MVVKGPTQRSYALGGTPPQKHVFCCIDLKGIHLEQTLIGQSASNLQELGVQHVIHTASSHKLGQTSHPPKVDLDRRQMEDNDTGSCLRSRVNLTSDRVEWQTTVQSTSRLLNSVAFCSPAKSLTVSGSMENPLSWQKVKVPTSQQNDCTK